MVCTVSVKLYSQTGCSFDGNSAMLQHNVPIPIDSLIEATCNFQFKFARVSCQVPVVIFSYKTRIYNHLCKFKSKVASCDKQIVNQYWNIALQHCRVPIKRTSGLTVKVHKHKLTWFSSGPLMAYSILMSMFSSLVTGYNVPTKTHGPNRTGKGLCIIYWWKEKKNRHTCFWRATLYRCLDFLTVSHLTNLPHFPWSTLFI